MVLWNNCAKALLLALITVIVVSTAFVASHIPTFNHIFLFYHDEISVCILSKYLNKNFGKNLSRDTFDSNFDRSR